MQSDEEFQYGSNGTQLSKIVCVGKVSTGKSAFVRHLILSVVKDTINQDKTVRGLPLLRVLSTSGRAGTRRPIIFRLIDSAAPATSARPDGSELDLNLRFGDDEAIYSLQRSAFETIVQLVEAESNDKSKVFARPVYVTLQGPGLPNWEIVDLPGLTNTPMPLTVDGDFATLQPTHLEDLVRWYVAKPNTAVVVIESAKSFRGNFSDSKLFPIIQSIDKADRWRSIFGSVLLVLSKCDQITYNTMFTRLQRMYKQQKLLDHDASVVKRGDHTGGTVHRTHPDEGNQSSSGPAGL